MDMTGQPKLWTPAVEAAHMQVLYEGPRGWTCTLGHRREGEVWGERPSEFYGGLTTPELGDVICSSWYALLGL